MQVRGKRKKRESRVKRVEEAVASRAGKSADDKGGRALIDDNERVIRSTLLCSPVSLCACAVQYARYSECRSRV